MTPPSSDLETTAAPTLYRPSETPASEPEPEAEALPEDDVEMSLFDHLEELRQRLFYSVAAVAVSAIACFVGVRPLVAFLERPAQGIRFLQLSPGEFFFVSIKVAGYSGLLLASPIIQIGRAHV